MPELTAERLREVLHYDPETGHFNWRQGAAKGRAKRCGRAGYVNGHLGYVMFVVDGKTLYGHRAAWLYVHGEFPKQQIDHINGDRADNRIANLRDVSKAENQKNIRKATRRSKSGLLGVCWSKGMKKWEASIRVDGVVHRLGYFQSAEAAYESYVSAKRKLHSTCTI